MLNQIPFNQLFKNVLLDLKKILDEEASILLRCQNHSDASELLQFLHQEKCNRMYFLSIKQTEIEQYLSKSLEPKNPCYDEIIDLIAEIALKAKKNQNLLEKEIFLFNLLIESSDDSSTGCNFYGPLGKKKNGLRLSHSRDHSNIFDEKT